LFEAVITADPEDISSEYDLLVNFKDGIGNTQIPTPNWYGGRLDRLVKEAVEGGCGYLCIHCGMANVPKDSLVFKDVLRGRFIEHPPACPIFFKPVFGHPVTEGIKAFEVFDEHYVVEVLEESTTILGKSKSAHGEFNALWAHEAGKGRVCAVAPGHSLAVLTHPMYSLLLGNAAKWCVKLL
jgi:type 1 glutamine amidotransferase